MSLDLAVDSPSVGSGYNKGNPGDHDKGDSSVTVDRSPKATPPRQDRRRTWLGIQNVRKLLPILGRTLLAPFRFYLSVRRSMTTASVALLLSALLSCNVIWGFPWSGLLGGCVALLLVGFALNRLLQPRMNLSVSLPRSATAGHPFSVNVNLSNTRFTPALNLRVGFHREVIRDVFSHRPAPEWEASPPVSISVLRSGDQMQWHGTMRFDRRGIHSLPHFLVISSFPFHLFRIQKAIDTETQIAITPTPASTHDDASTRMLLTTIGDWAQQLVAGAPVEYIGNREYQDGVAVRKWDFASWARLGRPIVREYQSPSIQAVTVIVDTSQFRPAGKHMSRAQSRRSEIQLDAEFEHLMSIAASSIMDISSRRVQLTLYLTSEPELEASRAGSVAQPNEGTDRLMVRLAAAEPTDPQLGMRRLVEAVDSRRAGPVLVLSLVSHDDETRMNWIAGLPPSVNYIAVNPQRPSLDAAGESP